jgi:hypothetical protein
VCVCVCLANNVSLLRWVCCSYGVAAALSAECQLHVSQTGPLGNATLAVSLGSYDCEASAYFRLRSILGMHAFLACATRMADAIWRSMCSILIGRTEVDWGLRGGSDLQVLPRGVARGGHTAAQEQIKHKSNNSSCVVGSHGAELCILVDR